MFTGTTGTADMTVEAEAGGSAEKLSDYRARYGRRPRLCPYRGRARQRQEIIPWDVAFNVATSLTLASLGFIYGDATATGVSLPRLRAGRPTTSFLLLGAAERGFMTIQTKKHTSIASGAGTSTRGTLYGPKGLITMDDNSGAGGNFKLSAPVAAGNYIVKVEGQGAGPYELDISTDAATDVAPGATSSCGRCELLWMLPRRGQPLSRMWATIRLLSPPQARCKC